MAAYYFDSSAIVKRYVQEIGTARVRRLTRRGKPDPIYLARITVVEVTAALARRKKGGSLTGPRTSSILTRFRRYLAARYHILEVTPGLLTAATTLAYSHGLRAYDAVQLAVALELNQRWLSAGLGGITPVSSDKELNTAALVEGLIVEDPTLDP